MLASENFSLQLIHECYILLRILSPLKITSLYPYANLMFKKRLHTHKIGERKRKNLIIFP